MLRPSRDWRESITLSSRDPHFGQRIVSEHSVSHNNLWRQCARFTIGRKTGLCMSGGHRLPLQKSQKSESLFARQARGTSSCASISNRDTLHLSEQLPLRGGSFGRGNFF